MVTLTEVKIHKYKCIETEQTFSVENDTTILVGMNESGKTAVLEAIAKTNYFQDDEKFKFNKTHDYPRKEKKKIDKSGEDPIAITCKYLISDELLDKIKNDVGEGVFAVREFSVSTKYSNRNTSWEGVKVNFHKFISHKIKELGLEGSEIEKSLRKVTTNKELDELIGTLVSKSEGNTVVTESEETKEKLEKIKPYFKNEWGWNATLGEYIARIYLDPNLPKFLYYDEYYSLPSRISIEKLRNEKLEKEELKTGKALFELADINIDDLIHSKDFEDYKAELEATEVNITDELFKYWTTNQNLDIEFDIDKIVKQDPDGNKRIVEHILDIRVKNQRSKVSLPLKNRSKGFNWFFSFLVWFKKIQEDKDSNYVLLLDEPGLNLHASAQNDLLKFIEDLSKKYQVIYTTHSPFMIDPPHLERVRTVVETDNGSRISDSIQEKDPNTLFPLQAALGYDIAQNLFISKNNLLLEGTSDLIYLQVMSGVLENDKRKHLREDITIVPVGGLDKVSTFVSLLRGNKLGIVCLLDSYLDSKSKAKLEDLIKQNIIKRQNIKFFDEFIDKYPKADIEDLFAKEEYLKLFNSAFNEHKDIQISDLNSKINQIILQINKHLGIDRFNHYRPANQLAKKGVDGSYFQKETLDNFEKLFITINKLFK